MQNHCVNAYPTTCWHTQATKYDTLVEIKNILSMHVSPSVNIFFVQFANLLYITVEHKSHIFISKIFQSVAIEFYKWRWWCAVYGYKKDDLIRCILWTHTLEKNSQSVFYFLNKKSTLLYVWAWDLGELFHILIKYLRPFFVPIFLNVLPFSYTFICMWNPPPIQSPTHPLSRKKK